MSLDCDPELVLRLVGPLRLSHRDGGRDLTPRSLKAQGLLALIGSAPALRRSRAWLQDKLWSDRPPEQGSASLRQTIHRLREAAGADSGWLITEPGWIGLDPMRVCVVLDPEARDWEATGEPPEFCEGLDIADPEFEDWLRDQRFAFEDRVGDAPPPPRPPSLIRVITPPPPDGVMLFVAAVDIEDRGVAALARILSTQVAMAVGRIGGARVQLEENGGPEPVREALRLAVHGCRVGDKAMIQARLSEDGLLVWSNNLTIPVGVATDDIDRALERFIAEVMAAAVHHLGRGDTGEGRSLIRAGYRALENVFALDGTVLSDCERVFAATSDGPAVNIHRAWRAQIRVFSIIERLPADPAEAGREAIDLIAGALSADPLNPMIDAIASDVAMHVEENPQKAAQLAQRAVERDVNSPYGRACSAQALAGLGQVRQAHLEAMCALRLAAALPNQSLWLIRCCVTAVRCGLYQEATGYAQAAHDMAPTYRPPLRFLAALRFHERNEFAAAQALRRLKALEPDFSLDLMEHREYPVTSLRNTPLIEVTKSGLL